MKISGSIAFFLFSLVAFLSCGPGKRTEKTGDPSRERPRIVSLNGAVSEWLCVFGLQEQIVAADVTSNYPAAMQEKPKLGFGRSISAEGILSHDFDVLVGIQGEAREEVLRQVGTVGREVLLLPHEYSVEGVLQLGRTLKERFAPTTGDVAPLEEQIRSALAAIIPFEPEPPRVLFIYARGGGNVLVGGRDTKVKEIIELAGATSAVVDFTGYKPLTAESLVAANPDVFLLFDRSLQHLEDGDLLFQMHGADQTQAGKRQAVVTMEAQFLSGFGPRLGDAALELNKKLHDVLADGPQ